MARMGYSSGSKEPLPENAGGGNPRVNRAFPHPYRFFRTRQGGVAATAKNVYTRRTVRRYAQAYREETPTAVGGRS